MTPTQLVQKQLDAYNAQDVAALAACYAPDCQIVSPDGAVTEKSREDVAARYTKAFAQFPQNHANLTNRIAVGNSVVDHEHVVRAPGGEEFEIIAIYTVKDGLIARVNFAK